MKIEEVEPDKQINVTKFQMSCDVVDQSIPRPLPQKLGFFLLMCAKPGMGKTNLILSLVCKNGKAFNKKFDKIFLWSPSINTVSNDPFETLPDDQKFDDIDIENLEEVLDEIRDSGERVLFIWDDIVNQIRSNGQLEKKCHKVLMNRRHLCGAGGCCSVIMTTQVYNKTSAPLRKVASHLFLWKTSNKKELETIYDEMVMIPRDEWFSILRHTFQRKHDFLYMDLTKNEKSMFHRNFNLLKFQSAGSEIERKAKD